jgi:hypothetical protein
MKELHMLFEQYLDKINTSDLTPDEKRDALAVLYEDGRLQNAPSQKYSGEQISSFMRGMAAKGIIAPESLPQMNADGSMPLPQPVPSMAQPTPDVVQQQPPVVQDPEAQLVGPGMLSKIGTYAGDVARDAIGSMMPGGVRQEHVQQVVQQAQNPELRRKGISDFGFPNAGEIAGAAGMGALGGAVAGVPGMVIGGIIGGALGAGGGLYVGRTITGQPVSLQDVGIESLASILPEFLEAKAKAALIFGAKRAPEAQKIVSDLIATRARSEAGQAIYAPANKETLDNLFSVVHASGTKANPAGLNDAVGSFTKEQWHALREEMKLWATTRNPRLGSEMGELLSHVKDGHKGIPEMNVSGLLDLRSQIAKSVKNWDATEGMDVPKRTLLQGIDRVIDETLDSKSNAMLKEAKREWAKYRASDTLTSYVSRPPVATIDAKNEFASFDLGALAQIIKSPTPGVQSQIAKDLDAVPGAREAFTKWLGEMTSIAGKVRVSTHETTVGQLLDVNGWMGQILGSFQGREALKRRILSDPAPLSMQELSLLANAARRGAKVTHGEEYERHTLGYIGAKALEKLPK